jgi:hypothetical protein
LTTADLAPVDQVHVAVALAIVDKFAHAVPCEMLAHTPDNSYEEDLDMQLKMQNYVMRHFEYLQSISQPGACILKR